ASSVAGTAARCAAEREHADRAIRRRPLGDDGAAATDVQAAAGEVPDEGVGAVQDVAADAAGNAGGELEERPAHRLSRRGRGRGRGGGGAGGRRRRGGGGGGGGRAGGRADAALRRARAGTGVRAAGAGALRCPLQDAGGTRRA